MSPHQLVALVRVAERLQGRNGIRRDTETAREIFPEVIGQTRDMAAAKAGLGSGKTLEALNGTKPCTAGYMVAT